MFLKTELEARAIIRNRRGGRFAKSFASCANAQVALRSMPFFQRLCNLRLRINKSNNRSALITIFFQDVQSQNNF